MLHSILRRIAYSWFGYVSRGLLPLAVGAVLAATPTGPPASNGNQSSHDRDREATPSVNWNK